MAKEKQPGVTFNNTENRKLAYANEFRNMLRENPGIAKTAIELTDKAIAEYNPPNVMVGNRELKYERATGKWLVQKQSYAMKDDKIALDEKGGAIIELGEWIPMDFERRTILSLAKPIVDNKTGLEVAVLGRSNRDFGGSRLDKCDYLKMTKGGQSFFVKRSFISINPGVTEFENTLSAKELLKDLDFIKVVEPQLGYQDQHESWYVSKWEDFETDKFGPHARSFDDYGTLIAVPVRETEDEFLGFASEEEFKDVEQKVKQIKDRLKTSHVHRDLGNNLFYSRETKTFFLLDVTGEDTNKMLGNPLHL